MKFAKINLHSRKTTYFVGIFFWIIAIVAKYKYSGLMYGLDFGLYHPDGTLYTFRTLTFMGNTQQHAAQLIAHWYSIHGAKLKIINPKSLFFNASPSWDQYKLRILYPLLSIPFVFMLGIKGMLVIPALSFLILVISCIEIGHRFNRPLGGLVFGVSLTLSITVLRWMTVNTTDSLLVGLTSLVAVVLTKEKHDFKWRSALVALLFLTSATRIAIFLWLAIAVVLFLKRDKKFAAILALLDIACFVPILFGSFQRAVLPGQGNVSLFSKLLHLPGSILKVGFYEIAELAVLDRFFFLLLVVGIVIASINIRALSSMLFLSVLFALWVTGGVNGTVGVNFRYELPSLAFLGWVYIESGPGTWNKIQSLMKF